MKQIWMSAAAVCTLLASVLLLRRDFDEAFIVATIGALAWFLSYRVRTRDMIRRIDDTDETDQDVD
ncbi:MAG: hypothetical protein ABR555_12920 [Pyrinomonadaceae bacterium]